MFEKIVDVLKQVFWLKKSSKKRSKKIVKTVSKPAKKKIAKKPAPKKTVLKKIVKAPAKPVKVPKVKKSDIIDPSLTQIGQLTHYFERIKVGVVKITQGTVLVGDRLTIKTKVGSFVQKVWSMQIESQDVKVAKKGQLIGLKLDKLVSVGDLVYK